MGAGLDLGSRPWPRVPTAVACLGGRAFTAAAGAGALRIPAAISATQPGPGGSRAQAEYKDWWWKARLGKCYYQLGLNRDAERQFLSVLKVPGAAPPLRFRARVHARARADSPTLRCTPLHPNRQNRKAQVARSSRTSADTIVGRHCANGRS